MIQTPKTKAAKVDDNVNQIAEVELCHNDEDMFDAGLDDAVGPLDDEDDYTAGQTEGEGPPEVSADKLKSLDEQAALDEIDKLYKMEVIQPVFLSPEEANNSNTVDTTLVFDWRYRNDSWIRRCMEWPENSGPPTQMRQVLHLHQHFQLCECC